MPFDAPQTAARTAVDILAGHLREHPIGPRARRAGVYLLILSDEVVYVGATGDLDARIEKHEFDRRKKSGGARFKDFDRVLWLALPARVLGHYEGALIRALVPRHNHVAPADRGHDKEILAGLGLPVPTTKRANGAAWSTARDRRYWEKTEHRAARRMAAEAEEAAEVAQEIADADNADLEVASWGAGRRSS